MFPEGKSMKVLIFRKGTLPNFDPLDGKSIVWTIDFWTNFSTRSQFTKLKMHSWTIKIVEIIKLNDQASLNLMIKTYSLNSVKTATEI